MLATRSSVAVRAQQGAQQRQAACRDAMQQAWLDTSRMSCLNQASLLHPLLIRMRVSSCVHVDLWSVDPGSSCEAFVITSV